jgi:hypothetical protein
MAAALSIRVRRPQTLLSEIASAITSQRSVVRTWAMRGTLHLIAANDLRRTLKLLAPVFLPGVDKRLEKLGLDAGRCARGVEMLGEALREGPLTRAQLRERLLVTGPGLDISGQRAPHLLSRASFEGLICHGPVLAGKPTYVLISDWLPEGGGPDLDRDEALAGFALRYFAAFGPAEVGDLAAWSGLPISLARRAAALIADEAGEIEVDGRSMLAGRLPLGPSTSVNNPVGDTPNSWGEPATVVRLLPAFDTFLLGYRDRSWAVDPSFALSVNAGGGLIRPTIMVDGRIAGTWRHKIGRGGATVDLQPFAELPSEAGAGLDAEVMSVEQFLNPDNNGGW